MAVAQAFHRETVTTTPQAMILEPGHTVPLWSPEKIDLSRKKVGFQRLEARALAVFLDQAIPERDQSETIFGDTSGQPRRVVKVTKTALACAVEVLIQFGRRGAVILDSLIDRPFAAIVAFDQKLAAKGWHDFEKVDRLDGLIKILQEITDEGGWSDEGEARAAQDLMNGVNTAIAWRSQYADDIMGEAQRAREGKQGRAAITRHELAYIAEVGLTPPAEVSALDVKAAVGQSPIIGQGVQPEVLELMQANNAALVGVFSEAMDKFAQALNLAKGEQNGNTKEGGETGQTETTAKAKGKEGGAVAGSTVHPALAASGAVVKPEPVSGENNGGSYEPDPLASIINDASNRVAGRKSRNQESKDPS